MAQRNIWNLGFQAANNPSVAKQFLHSKTIHGAKRSFQKKSGYARMAAKAVSFGSKFIPVPYVADVLNKGIQLASDKLRKYRIKQKKGAADSTDPSLEKLVKFTIKDLNISDMDRYRLKIKEAQDDFSAATGALAGEIGKHTESGDVCKAFFNVAEKRGYLVRRLIKMRAKTQALREITILIDKWCAEVEAQVNGWQRENNNVWQAMFESYPASTHENCPDDICVMKSGPGPKGPGQFGTALCKLTSQAADFLTLDDLVDYALDEAADAGGA